MTDLQRDSEIDIHRRETQINRERLQRDISERYSEREIERETDSQRGFQRQIFRERYTQR